MTAIWYNLENHKYLYGAEKLPIFPLLNANSEKSNEQI